MFEIAILMFFPFLMVYSASSDILSMTISNKVSLALIIGFLALAVGLGLSWQTVLWHFALFAIVLFGGFALFAAGIIGGGDAKLAASTVLWLGWDHTFIYLLIASAIGGALTLLLLSMRSKFMPRWLERQPWAAKLYRADTGVPYGVALGAAALVVYPSTIWMQYIFDQARII